MKPMTPRAVVEMIDRMISDTAKNQQNVLAHSTRRGPRPRAPGCAVSTARGAGGSVDGPRRPPCSQHENGKWGYEAFTELQVVNTSKK